MPRQLLGTAIAANTITTTQLQTTIVNNITQGGGPRVTSLIYPGNDTAANTVGGQTVYVLGSGFASNAAVYINGNSVPSVSFISASNIAITTPALSSATYPIYVINPETGATAIFVPGLIISGEPSWVTSAGSLSSSQDESNAWSYTLSATGDAPITYALAAGSSLPTGVSLAANGVISGTISSPSGTATTYTFSVVATDAQNQDSTRQFAVTTTAAEGALFANNVLLIHADGTNNGNNHQFLDSSNNNSTITRYGNATQGSFSPFSQTGWSAYFDGTGDYLSISDNTDLRLGTGNFTVELWAYPTGGSSWRGLVSKGAASSGWAIIISNTGVWAFSSTTDNYFSNVTVQNNVWYHLALVRSGTSVVLYVNGVSAATATLSTDYNHNNTLYIGASRTADIPFTGYISNVRIVKGTAVYTSAFTPSTTPLTAIANTTLLTCQSNRFRTEGDSYAIVNAKVYSTYNGGTRSNNYTVQYSDDNVSWTNAFSGVMESASQCGLVTGAGGGGSYGSHKYWKYIVGTAVTQHHPRASRIVLTDSNGVDYNVATFTSDNCSDSGTIPANGDSYILSRDFAITRNGDVSIQPFSSFAPTDAYTTANVGGSVYLDGTGDYLTFPTNNLLLSSNNFTAEAWVYLTTSPSTAAGVFYGQGDGSSAAGSSYGFVIAASTTSDIYVGSTGYSITSPTPKVGEWAHVAWARTGGTLSSYLNGARVGTRSDLGSSAINNGSTSKAPTIGAVNAGGAYLLTGYISNARLIAGNGGYDATQTTITVPTTPLTNIANTSLLCNFTNAQIFDQTAKNVLECVGDAKVSTAQYKYGTGSIAFDGTGDWLLLPANRLLDLSGDFTIETWLYPTATFSTYRMIIANKNASPDGYICIRDGNRLEIVIAGSLFSQTTVTVPQNSWTHLAVTRSGSSVKAFIDGTAVLTSTSSATWNFSNNNGTYIGRWGSGGYEWYGYMDDFRITNGYARYTSNFTPPTSALKDK